MYHTVPQPVSPVTSPRISAPGQVFGQVRDVSMERLGHTLHNPTRIPNLIAQSRAVSPQARIDNTLPAEIADYTAPQGRQLARYMRLDIQNTPGPPVDAIIDAIQRYLDIRPRREPTADPLDEDSIARHPQQITQAAGRWADERYFQFSANGAETYQFRPSFHTWSGRLDLRLENPGQADISTPASLAPGPGRAPTTPEITYDSTYAVQEALTAMTTTNATNWTTVGPPIMTKDPYFNPAYAGQNAASKIQTLLAPSSTNVIPAGAPNMADDPYFDPAFAGQNALAKGLTLLHPGLSTATPAGASNPAVTASQTALQTIQALVGPIASPAAAPEPVTTQQPAYQKAMRSMQQLDRTMRNARVLGGWA